MSQKCHRRSSAEGVNPALSLVIRSSETAAVKVGAFADVSPIHDRRAKLFVAPVDFFGKLVCGAGLGNDFPADLGETLQQGVVELQDFHSAFIPKLAQ